MRNNFAEIDLENLRHNINVVRSRIEPGTKYLAVVKANAYGHGIVQIAECAVRNGADYLGVAIAEEGILLRQTLRNVPILILGATDEAHMDEVIFHRLTPAIFTVDSLLALEAHAARLGKTCRFHFKIDTGMNRIGFKDPSDFSAALKALAGCKHLVFDGMFTHFAVSERPDPSFTEMQGERFRAFAALAHEHGFQPVLHASNSAAALHLADLQFDMVRGGIAMYGCHPAGHAVDGVDLRPVLSWKTAVVHVKEIEAGEGVSYGLRFVAPKRMRVATLPVGYGDGYKRCLSGKAEVLLGGRRIRQIGTICMDQMMVDVTDYPDVAVGDEAVLLGTQGAETITADEMADMAGTISYEILLSISDRVPRVYIDG